jgi:acetyltransferase-like isoleucine patch superfamily enzyme
VVLVTAVAGTGGVARATGFERSSYECGLIAERRTGWHPSYAGRGGYDEAKRGPSAKGALMGTGAGAATGALIGAGVGRPGRGAAIGAGVGLMGGLIGSSIVRDNRARRAAEERAAERRMTAAYWAEHDRCMAASGY